MKENRASFFARLSKKLAPSHVRLAMLGYMVAKAVHRGQVRQELDENGDPVPYFEHLRRAAIIAIDLLGIRDIVVICKILLHDSIEDSKLDPDFIEQFFGPDVVVGVLNVTKLEGESERTAAAHLFASGDWRDITAKLCDRFDNIRSLYACSREKRLRKLAETRELYLPGFQKLCEMVPPHLRDNYVACVRDLVKMMDDLERDAADPDTIERARSMIERITPPE